MEPVFEHDEEMEKLLVEENEVGNFDDSFIMDDGSGGKTTPPPSTTTKFGNNSNNHHQEQQQQSTTRRTTMNSGWQEGSVHRQGSFDDSILSYQQQQQLHQQEEASSSSGDELSSNPGQDDNPILVNLLDDENDDENYQLQQQPLDPSRDKVWAAQNYQGDGFLSFRKDPAATLTTPESDHHPNDSKNKYSSGFDQSLMQMQQQPQLQNQHESLFLPPKPPPLAAFVTKFPSLMNSTESRQQLQQNFAASATSLDQAAIPHNSKHPHPNGGSAENQWFQKTTDANNNDVQRAKRHNHNGQDRNITDMNNENSSVRVSASNEVIDLLDSDNERQEENDPLAKRQKTATDDDDAAAAAAAAAAARTAAAKKAYYARKGHIPDWMTTKHLPEMAAAAHTRMILPGASMTNGSLESKQIASDIQSLYGGAGRSSAGSNHGTVATYLASSSSSSAPFEAAAAAFSSHALFRPDYLALPDGFVPTWERFMPGAAAYAKQHRRQQQQERRFQLSLLNVNEFTIEGLPTRHDGPPTSVAGLRVPIRKISRKYGKAVFDQSKEQEEDEADNGGAGGGGGGGGGGESRRSFVQGKWRIPLGAYRAFFSYLTSDPQTQVIGIPQHQLDMASLERTRQEKGFPSTEDIIKVGVPEGLGKALAPFQRGGVDFVVSKKGRALIADEMGLGKTVQAIASMSVYRDEWPVLVLTPSSARYHWESEFYRWLGVNSQYNKETSRPERLIQRKSQIHVLTNSKAAVLPSRDTLVVICSYGLAPALIGSGNMWAGQFKCAIVDESHMLKNKATKRTAQLTPLLMQTIRCILLSGTPALSRPVELLPQLNILGTTSQHNWFQDESEFMLKYVKRGTSRTRAELHALLTATIMIRRLKNDIMKSMKPKHRQKAQLHVVTKDNQDEFKYLLNQLRQGRGVLAKLARTKEMRNIQADVRRQVREEQNEITQQTASAYSTNPDLGKEKDSERSKRAILSRLYSLTGEVKIPVIADMLNRWLDDPTKGKVCIFAHHLNVLDSIRDLCKLSNNKFSARQFIRIDGSTLPKVRQEEINRFQTEPQVRVGLLGITAAGVAVTLTAASTVWFAELFWTPAIMIQAEDRCHRIGQQGQVECVYFVGRGTLDDVLWKLVEKKFQQLGEFVEGRDKEKMVIHKTWDSAKEFKTIFETRESMNSEDDSDVEDDDFGSYLVPLDKGLEHEIEAFGEDEKQMLKNLDADDEEGETNSNDGDTSKPAATKRTSSSQSAKVGSTEDAAITLSDDDEHDDDAPFQLKLNKNVAGLSITNSNSNNNNGGEFALFLKPLEGCRLYRISFQGNSLGLEILMIHGRPVVGALKPQRINKYGYDSKPAVGDVIVMVGGKELPIFPHDNSGATIQHFIQHAVRRPPTLIVFAEHAGIRSYVLEQMMQRFGALRRQNPSLPPGGGDPGTPDVIEID